MWNIIHGDSCSKLKELSGDSIQTCVTSPPYWQLRDYGNTNELGSESSPEEFVKSLVKVFDEVRRVLTKDGTLWLNLGDTYVGGGGYCPTAPSNLKGSKQSTNRGAKAKARPVPEGYKKKDLIGIPWMTALALRKSGWYLRADVIWDKPNGFPEKVTDRPTRTHEYVFLLSKSAKYFYDHKAIVEASADGGHRNCRAVWSIAKTNFSGAHFAVFPEELVEKCLLATTREGDRVLDPFVGSGTTGVVSLRLKRDFTGIELNETYCQMARERIQAQSEKGSAKFGSLAEPAE
jgi:site-specific DNA-methyltransferase (cytosine-N4-specific)